MIIIANVNINTTNTVNIIKIITIIVIMMRINITLFC